MFKALIILAMMSTQYPDSCYIWKWVDYTDHYGQGVKPIRSIEYKDSVKIVTYAHSYLYYREDTIFTEKDTIKINTHGTKED